MSDKIYTINGIGDIGDEIYAMPIARALGKASFLVFDSPQCKSITTPARFNSVKPLIESQPYVERFDLWKGEPVDYDAASFRSAGLPFGENLCKIQSDYIGVKVSEEPWLEVEPNKEYVDKIVVARSPRHQNPYFPWNKLVAHYHESMVFIGLRSEYVEFSVMTGYGIPYRPTQDLLEAAQIIEASKLFIGNQSSPLAIAIGLGKRAVIECSLSAVDTVFRRPDSRWVVDGKIDNLCVEGHEPFSCDVQLPAKEVDFLSSPPGGQWHVKSSDGTEHKDFMVKKLVHKANEYEKSCNLPLTTRQDITNYMLQIHPRWNRSNYSNAIHDTAKSIRELVERVNS